MYKKGKKKKPNYYSIIIAILLIVSFWIMVENIKYKNEIESIELKLEEQELILDTQIGKNNKLEEIANKSQVVAKESTELAEESMELVKKWHDLYFELKTGIGFRKSIADIYDVEWELMEAIYKHETANFTSEKYSEHNNICGMFDKGSPVHYYSIEQSVIACVRNIRFNFHNNGLYTINEIGNGDSERNLPGYAPIGATNDPNNLNENWVPRVTQYYNDFKGGK